MRNIHYVKKHSLLWVANSVIWLQTSAIYYIQNIKFHFDFFTYKTNYKEQQTFFYSYVTDSIYFENVETLMNKK